jgi:hypothetical protein
VRRLVLLALPLALTACGSSAQYAAGPRVSLKVAQPSDPQTVRAPSLKLQGSVSPSGASVQVNGEDATVSGSSFSADVKLDPGANVIDVTASAPGHRPEADAVRVTYDTRVEIPDVIGQPSDDAENQLVQLGFDVTEDRQGSFLDKLFPGNLQVCSTDPAAHKLEQKGTPVTVTVARDC